MSTEEHIAQLMAQITALQAQLAHRSWSPPPAPAQPSAAQPFMLQYNSLLYLYAKDFFPWKNSIKSYDSNSGSLIEFGAVVAEIWSNLWVILAYTHPYTRTP